MTYSSTTTFNPTTGALSGTLTSNAGSPPNYPSIANEPVSHVVISAYADAAVLSGGAAWFGQARSAGDGSWSLSTATLPAGLHSVAITADYGPVVATTTITASGPGVNFAALGSARTGLQPNSAARL